MKIKCEVEVSRGRLADVLCSGMEGGIGYWSAISEYVTPPEGADLFADLEGWDRDSGVFRHINYPMCEAGGSVVLTCADDDRFANGQSEVTLDYAALVRGLSVMAEKYPRHFADIINESDDATTGDVLVQCAVFGEIVYG